MSNFFLLLLLNQVRYPENNRWNKTGRRQTGDKVKINERTGVIKIDEEKKRLFLCGGRQWRDLMRRLFNDAAVIKISSVPV